MPVPSNPGIVGGKRRMEEAKAQGATDSPGDRFWDKGCEMGTVSQGVKIEKPNVPDVNAMAKKKGKK